MAVPGPDAAAPRGGAAEFSIDRDGGWHYRGSPILREPLVRLLAGMLRRAGAAYVLETPEQRLRITVADAPFVITDFECEPSRLVFITNLGERVPVDALHPLVLREDAARGETRLYQLLDEGLEALVHRNVFYRLAERVEPGGADGRPGIFSDGMFFPLA